jgi:hypothetical protein
MAPKKDKKVKEPEPPPSEWVARSQSKEWMQCIEGAVTHLRAGRPDAVRGKTLLAQGKFKLAYEVTHSTSSNAQDILLGVCDASAWAAEESKDGITAATEALQNALGQSSGRRWQTFGRHGHAAAWGFEPRTGRLVTSPDVNCGKRAGGILGKCCVPNEVDEAGRPLLYAFPRKSTVVFEIELPELSDQHFEIARRAFSTGLHPLNAGALRGREAIEPPAAPAAPPGHRTLAVSLNGGPFVDCGIALPPAVFPWVMLTWQDDQVTLVSCEKCEGQQETGR